MKKLCYVTYYAMQKRLFLLSSILLIVSGLLHFIGQFTPTSDPALAALLKQMSQYTFSLGSVEATLVDVMQSWGVYFGLLVIIVGAQNLLFVQSLIGNPSEGAILYRLVRFTLIVSALLVAIGMLYNAIFPIFFYSLTTLTLLWALLAEKKTTSASERLRKLRLIMAWCAAAYLAWMLIEMGVVKFDDNGFWTPAFERWGYPTSLRLLVGFIEVIGAVMILIPWSASYGAAGLTFVMLGAWVTRLNDGRMKDVYWLTVYLCLLVWIAFEWWQWRKPLLSWRLPLKSMAS